MGLEAGGPHRLQQAQGTGWESCTQTAAGISSVCHPHPFPQPAHPSLFSRQRLAPGTQQVLSRDGLEVEGPGLGLCRHVKGRSCPLHLGSGPGTLSAPVT